MSDTDNNGQNITEGTVAPVPSAEQPAEGAQEPQLPDGVKERTAEEFEKLKARNKQMADELAALKGSNPSRSSVLDELRPNLDIAPTAPIPMAGFQQPAPQMPIVDEGGYIDATLLNSTLTKAQREAEEARRIAQQTQNQIQRFQESQLMQAVHKEFPEMDPNNPDQFDPTFYDFVKNDLIGQAFQGKEDVRAAALKAKQVLGSRQSQQPGEPRKETISSREQASAPTGTSHSTPPPADDHQSLVQGTYKGDKDAIFKRLQASGN